MNGTLLVNEFNWDIWEVRYFCKVGEKLIILWRTREKLIYDIHTQYIPTSLHKCMISSESEGYKDQLKVFALFSFTKIGEIYTRIL